MLLSCLAIVAYATRFFVATPRDEHFARYIVPLRLHIAGGMGALLAGPWQFSQRLRARAESASLAWPILFARSRARLDRGLRLSPGIERRPRHTFGIRNSGRVVVCDRSASLPHSAPGKH